MAIIFGSDAGLRENSYEGFLDGMSKTFDKMWEGAQSQFTTEQPVLENVPVVIDLGARVNGYCSDLSRTFILGNGDKTFSKIYDIVLGAQLTALATIEAGMNGGQADLLARAVVEQANYGEAFGHGLGHGVGLEAHESPRLGPNSQDLLVDGMVFTVEPGFYSAGWGGVRIEDTVVMENGKVKALTSTEKIAQAF